MSPSAPSRFGSVPLGLLAIVAALFALFACSLIGYVVATRPADLPYTTPTVRVVTVAAPGANPTLFTPSTLTPNPDLNASPTAPAPPPPAGDVHVGGYVQVTGTGDTGFLNLRAEPSLAAAVNYLAIEREVFIVKDGPRESGGVTWWLLVDPATQTRFGWGAQNYLQVVTGP